MGNRSSEELGAGLKQRLRRMSQAVLGRSLSRRIGRWYYRRGHRTRLSEEPGLRYLPHLREHARVARLFEQRWSAGCEGLPGPVCVHECELLGREFTAPQRSSAIYSLRLEDELHRSRQTLGVLEVRQGSVRARSYTEDPDLPWLTNVADPEVIRPRLAELLREELDGCQITPVRYWSGRRCTFRIDVGTVKGPLSLYGKVLLVRGEHLTRAVDALSELGMSVPGMPRTPRALAYWPDLHLLLLEALDHEGNLRHRLLEAADDPARCQCWLSQAGTHTAALHSTALSSLRVKQSSHELQSLQRRSLPLRRRAPEIAGEVDRFVNRVAKLVATLDEPPPATCHGELGLGKFLLNSDNLVLVDLDTLCLGNPAMDVGELIAGLRWMGACFPQHSQMVTKGEAAVLEAYGQRGPAPDERWLSVYVASTILGYGLRSLRSLRSCNWPAQMRLMLDVSLSACERWL